MYIREKFCTGEEFYSAENSQHKFIANCEESNNNEEKFKYLIKK